MTATIKIEALIKKTTEKAVLINSLPEDSNEFKSEGLPKSQIDTLFTYAGVAAYHSFVYISLGLILAVEALKKWLVNL